MNRQCWFSFLIGAIGWIFKNICNDLSGAFKVSHWSLKRNETYMNKIGHKKIQKKNSKAITENEMPKPTKCTKQKTVEPVESTY